MILYICEIRLTYITTMSFISSNNDTICRFNLIFQFIINKNRNFF